MTLASARELMRSAASACTTSMDPESKCWLILIGMAVLGDYAASKSMRSLA